jgi:hypothetical protein
MKVTAVAPGGNANLLTCVVCDYTGAVVGTHSYSVRKQTDHVVDDLIFVCRPGGGTGELQSGAAVPWHELPGAGGGGATYRMIVTDVNPATGLVLAKTWDGTTLGTTDIPVKKAMGHVLSDEIFATKVIGNTGLTYMATPVEHLEILWFPTVRQRYEVVQVLDADGHVGIDSAKFEA